MKGDPFRKAVSSLLPFCCSGCEVSNRSGNREIYPKEYRKFAVRNSNISIAAYLSTHIYSKHIYINRLYVMKPRGSRKPQWIHNALTTRSLSQVTAFANMLLQVPHHGYRPASLPRCPKPQRTAESVAVTSEAGITQAARLSALIFRDGILSGYERQLLNCLTSSQQTDRMGSVVSQILHIFCFSPLKVSSPALLCYPSYLLGEVDAPYCPVQPQQNRNQSNILLPSILRSPHGVYNVLGTKRVRGQSQKK